MTARLVESFLTPSGRETVTLYHPDGARLMLTHYCAQGNQPRLVAVEASPAQIRFEKVDATNVLAEQSMLVEMVLSLEADDHDRVERYRGADGAIEETKMRFTRTSTQ